MVLKLQQLAPTRPQARSARVAVRMHANARNNLAIGSLIIAGEAAAAGVCHVVREVPHAKCEVGASVILGLWWGEGQAVACVALRARARARIHGTVAGTTGKPPEC